MEGQEHSTAALDWLQNAYSAPLIVPPHRPEAGKQNIWLNAMQTTAIAEETAAPHAVLQAYSDTAQGYLKRDAAAMLAGIAKVKEGVSKEIGADAHALRKGAVEQKFNHVEPFYKASVLCVMALLCGFVSWFGKGRFFEFSRLSGWWLVFVSMLLLTAGIITRMWLEGRPPVTTLYSSALFIGWGATLFGLLFERIWPYSVALVASAIIGFLSLLIAHFLALDGDTMVMLQAVLDTNIWLATHVVVVTFGYVATFVAGFVGIIYVIRRLIAAASGEGVPAEFGRVCSYIVFAITCFGVLFSFVGTVLGGIWADQSWGRFWGWDPKENGALMIVLWNALILHARLGGLVKERGLMNLAILGNIVTAWSWFGTNQLGIGLHSYGFTNAAALALVIFVILNLLIMFPTIFMRPTAQAAKE
jgi:ABC-type transport system involved in cytochrome c biogenesis permease subunit